MQFGAVAVPLVLTALLAAAAVRGRTREGHAVPHDSILDVLKGCTHADTHTRTHTHTHTHTHTDAHTHKHAHTTGKSMCHMHVRNKSLINCMLPVTAAIKEGLGGFVH